LQFRGASERLKREQNERAWLAWHIAYLPRSKKPVKLKDMMSAAERRPTGRSMTPEQIEAVTRSWLAGRRKR
jgi:Uri superfamily endonuclease